MMSLQGYVYDKKCNSMVQYTALLLTSLGIINMYLYRTAVPCGVYHYNVPTMA